MLSPTAQESLPQISRKSLQKTSGLHSFSFSNPSLRLHCLHSQVTMRIPTSLIAIIIAVQIPTSIAAPVAVPDGCQSTSINGQTTTTGECGPNQNAQSSSSTGGSDTTSTGGSPDMSMPDISGDFTSDANSIIDKIKSEIDSFGQGS